MAESRTWFLTSTTYGTWLPGDERGFVGRVRERRPLDPTGAPVRAEHDQRGDDPDADIPGLRDSARALLKGNPVGFSAEQAGAVLAQFRATAEYRCWVLVCAAVMRTHFHLVVVAPPTIAPENMLRDFKSYASRALNTRWPRPRSGTWWTQAGSYRELNEHWVIDQKVSYVLLGQELPLALWPEEALPS